MGSDTDDVECGYCGRSALAYELRSDRGMVTRCIPCLAIEQGQQSLRTPYDRYDDSDVLDEDSRRRAWDSAADWFTVLARIQDDDPLVKRDPDATGTLAESTRTFLTNIMGSEAHYPPSEVVGSEVHAAQVSLTEAATGGDSV